ncbi:hypothetical protein BHE74_00056618 [Ensete ventricosum]|nr:hypothetical protein BHE74_00056618 [Ensete ventricosum]
MSRHNWSTTNVAGSPRYLFLADEGDLARIPCVIRFLFGYPSCFYRFRLQGGAQAMARKTFYIGLSNPWGRKMQERNPKSSGRTYNWLS